MISDFYFCAPKKHIVPRKHIHYHFTRQHHLVADKRHRRLFLAEILFAYSTDGANPIFWKVLESSSGLNAVVGVAHLGVVNPTTSVTYVLHNVKMY